MAPPTDVPKQFSTARKLHAEVKHIVTDLGCEGLADFAEHWTVGEDTFKAVVMAHLTEVFDRAARVQLSRRDRDYTPKGKKQQNQVSRDEPCKD